MADIHFGVIGALELVFMKIWRLLHERTGNPIPQFQSVVLIVHVCYFFRVLTSAFGFFFYDLEENKVYVLFFRVILIQLLHIVSFGNPYFLEVVNLLVIEQLFF